MRKTLTAALGAALLAAPAASAHPEHHYRGVCSIEMFQNGPDRWTAVGNYHVYATDATTGAPSPGTPLDAYCFVSIDGDRVVELRPGDTKVVEFTAEPGSTYTQCEHTTVGGETHVDCGDGELGGSEPPLLCAVLGAQDGGPFDLPPTLDFRPNGDIYTNGEWLFDCSPYDAGGS